VQEYAVEHVMISCQKYERERRNLIQILGEMKISFDLIGLLGK